MIFWWSVGRLTKFIDECMQRGYIRDEFDSLNEEVATINKSVDSNKRNIKALANAFNEFKKDVPSGESDIPIDMDALIAIIDDKMQAFSEQNDRNIASIKKRMDDVAHSQLTKSDVESIAKKYLNESPSNNGNVSAGELDKIITKVEKIERTIAHIDAEKITRADVESIVKQYLDSLDLHKATPIVDENAIASRVKSECIATLNNTITQNNAAINSTISNEIQRISALVEKADNTLLMAKLQADYEEEKKRSDSLYEIVKRQSTSIDLLMGKISDLTKRLELLEQGNEVVPPPIQNNLLFGVSSLEDEENLALLLSQAKVLKSKIVQICSGSDDVYIKLVDNLIDKLGKIIEKNKDKQYSADKLANEVSKVLKQTIIKGMSQEKVKDVVKQYMDDCGIRKLDWAIGKKISDNDYEYLEEPIIYVDVNNESESETIVAIIQDTYIIDYYEDDDKYEAIIPGMYRIGRYNR